jgi:hypothetical protein
MTSEGWSAGAVHDPAARTHDALVPFERLRPVDRRHTTLGVMAEEVMRVLADIPEYARTPCPELGEDDLRLGMRVTFMGDVAQQGSVTGWDIDPDWPGCVVVIRVRWDSGENHEYAAAERELYPLPVGSAPKATK